MAKNKLSPRQRRAILYLLSSRSVREASRKSGVPERTLYRWLQQPDFLQALRNAENQLLKDASRRLVFLSGQAIEVVTEILNSPDSSDNTRLRSAKIVFDNCLKIRKLIEIEEKVNSLEEIISEYTDY